jgi:hypothetical protein
LPGTPLRRSAPGRVEPMLARQMLTLASRGRAYGQWQQQVEIARTLAQDPAG